VRTLGIDLAAQPLSTGACVVSWRPSGAVATVVPPPVGDNVVLRLAADADVVAVDAPLGWPDSFVTAVTAHHSGQSWPGADTLALRYRLTDLEVALRTGVRPLSASSDLLAVCAFRAARLQGALGVAARDGSDRLVEAYPAGALRVWGLPATGYKRTRGAAVRAAIVESLERLCPWLSFDADALRHRDHDLDALLCALVARAAATGRTVLPTPDQATLAAREGWIHLPTCPPGELR
jgi:predicted nuclease with RNAse H fold